MAYDMDRKLASFDEEQPPQDGSDLLSVGWKPVSPEKVRTMRDRDFQYKKRLRTVRLVVRLMAFALACFMLYSQIYMLNKYLTTKDIIRDDRNAWASGTTLWPTIVLLVTSAITVLVTAITLISYVWGVKRANWTAVHVYVPWVVLEIVGHLVVWIATMAAYRAGKTGTDLWGWSCSAKADDIQSTFFEVDFDYSCDLQSDAWFTSIAQVVLCLISGIAWTLAWQRHKHQQKLRVRESLLVNSEYAPTQANPPANGPQAYSGASQHAPPHVTPRYQPSG